jgi:hypothetical protein
MFTADDIYQRVKGQPFVPVRIATSDGRSFDVYHPDLILVARRFVMIGTPSRQSPAHADLVTRVAMIHITALDDLPVRSKGGENGKKRRQ